MKFKKKLIEENKLSVNELVDLDGDFIQGGEKTHWDSEIKTGPINQPSDSDSDYEKGLSTVTDKMAQYANPRNWWQLLFGYGGTASHTSGSMMEEKLSESDHMRKKIVELLNNYTADKSFVSKNNTGGMNEIPSLDAIDDPAVSALVNQLMTALTNKDTKTVDTIMNFMQHSIKK